MAAGMVGPPGWPAIVVDAREEKIPAADLEDEIAAYARAHDTENIIVEDAAQQGLLIANLRKRGFAVIPAKPQRDKNWYDKPSRASQISPAFARGDIVFLGRKGVGGMEPIERLKDAYHEMKMCPQATAWNLTDAIVYLAYILTQPWTRARETYEAQRERDPQNPKERALAKRRRKGNQELIPAKVYGW